MQHIAKWDVDVSSNKVDTNGDGSLNNKDVTRLMQYVGGWEVELHFVPLAAPEGHTVVFCDYNGNALKLVTGVEDGAAVTAPSNPIRYGYRFLRWNKSFDCITGDLVVTAQYVQQFTVTFKDHDGTVLKTQVVDAGTHATPPANPTREGYTFANWDKMYTNVTMDLTVTALYTKDAAAPTIIISKAEAKAGDSGVQVTVAVKDNPGIASMRLVVSYADVLTLTGIEYNSQIGGMSQLPQSYDSPVILNWFNGTSNTEGDWVFATLTFDVSDSAAAGEYDITLTYDPENVYDISETNVTFAVVNGSISVSK